MLRLSKEQIDELKKTAKFDINFGHEMDESPTSRKPDFPDYWAYKQADAYKETATRLYFASLLDKEEWLDISRFCDRLYYGDEQYERIFCKKERDS